jgi:Ran GTPase-activating protein (RanGAP) involved in mRNA processing and transport
MGAMQYFGIQHNGIQNEGIRDVIRGLGQSQRTITTLRLSNMEGTRMGDWPTLIQDHLKCLTNLTYLGLGDMNLGDTGATTLATLYFPMATGLSTIMLQNNKIGHHGGKSVATAMMYLPKLGKLNISLNFIGPAAAGDIIDSLASKTTMTTLCMTSVKMRGDPAHNLEMRPLPESILSVDMALNGLGGITQGEDIRATGKITLLTCLGRCRQLACLCLDNNGLGDAEITQLLTGLLIHLPLRLLDLSGNGLSPRIQEPLSQALSEITTLHTLFMADNFLGSEGATKLLQ